MTGTSRANGALIIGASSGIGAATALDLSSHGYDVVRADLPGSAIAGTEDFVPIDVADEVSVAEAIQAADRAAGGLAVVVNSAGLLGPLQASADIDLEAAGRILAVNYLGALAVTKHALRLLVPRGYGRIVHIASIAGREGSPQMTSYSASKGAVIAMVKSVGREYAASGVTVNAVAPASIETPFLAGLTEERKSIQRALIPMGRLGTSEEVAALVRYVVSPDASFTTGYVFDASGGRFTG